MLTRIWLTYKQHRFETIAILVVCLGVAVAALIEAFRLNSMNVPFHCFQDYRGPYYPGPGQPVPDAATLKCNNLVEGFQGVLQSLDMSLVRMLLVFAPILAGIIVGAPLVAREIEQGTAPLSWSLSGPRRRWLLGKVLAGILLLVPVMLAVGPYELGAPPHLPRQPMSGPSRAPQARPAQICLPRPWRWSSRSPPL